MAAGIRNAGKMNGGDWSKIWEKIDGDLRRDESGRFCNSRVCEGFVL